jgi:hypothetical protein
MIKLKDNLLADFIVLLKKYPTLSKRKKKKKMKNSK